MLLIPLISSIIISIIIIIINTIVISITIIIIVVVVVVADKLDSQDGLDLILDRMSSKTMICPIL